MLTLAMSAYLILVVDLDHPYQRAFVVSESAFREVGQTMAPDN